MLTPGLYEQVISKALGQAIDGDKEHYIETLPIDAAEASKILSRYITEILEKSLNDVKDQGGDLRAQVDVANRIVQNLAAAAGDDPAGPGADRLRPPAHPAPVLGAGRALLGPGPVAACAPPTGRAPRRPGRAAHIFFLLLGRWASATVFAAMFLTSKLFGPACLPSLIQTSI